MHCSFFEEEHTLGLHFWHAANVQFVSTVDSLVRCSFRSVDVFCRVLHQSIKFLSVIMSVAFGRYLSAFFPALLVSFSLICLLSDLSSSCTAISSSSLSS